MTISQNQQSQQGILEEVNLYSHWLKNTDYSDTQIKILSELTLMLDGAWLDIYLQAIDIHKDRPQAAHYIALNIMSLAAQGQLKTPCINYNICVGLSESGKTWPNQTIVQSLPYIRSGVYRVAMPNSGDGLNSAFLEHPKPNCLFWKDEGLSDVYNAISSKNTQGFELAIYNKLLSLYGFVDSLDGGKNKLAENSTKSVPFPKLSFNIDAQDNIFKKCLDSRAVLDKGFIQRAFVWHIKGPKRKAVSRMDQSRKPKQKQESLAIKSLDQLNYLTPNFLETTDIKTLFDPPGENANFPNHSEHIPECNWEHHYNRFMDAIKDNPNLSNSLKSTERMEAKYRSFAQLHAWGRHSDVVEEEDVNVACLLISLHYANLRNIYINSFYTDNELLLFKHLGQKLIAASNRGVTVANLQVYTVRFANRLGDTYLKSRFSLTIRSILDSGYAIKVQNSKIGTTTRGYTLQVTKEGIEFFNSNLDAD